MEEQVKFTPKKSDTIDDGGPAFPDPVAISPAGDAYPSNWPGMSLRDWFAGQIMVAHIRNAGPHYHEDEAACVRCRLAMARRAYSGADAMLAAREARNA